MTPLEITDTRRPVVVAYAVFTPLVVGALLSFWRDRIPHATIVLALVVVIVGAGATGIRWAGWGASVSAALWFDWFHTVPHGSFAIASAEDLQVAALLLVVGVAVTELGLWGQRWQAEAIAHSARIETLMATASSVAEGLEVDMIAHDVEQRLVTLLDLDRATWVPGSAGAGAAILRRDGVIVLDGEERLVGREGFPTDTAVTLPVHGPVGILGRIDLVASAHVSWPTQAALRVAFLLADQLAAASARTADPQDGEPSEPSAPDEPTPGPHSV